MRRTVKAMLHHLAIVVVVAVAVAVGPATVAHAIRGSSHRYRAGLDHSERVTLPMFAFGSSLRLSVAN
jgi:hypothetical protein